MTSESLSGNRGKAGVLGDGDAKGSGACGGSKALVDIEVSTDFSGTSLSLAETKSKPSASSDDESVSSTRPHKPDDINNRSLITKAKSSTLRCSCFSAISLSVWISESAACVSFAVIPMVGSDGVESKEIRVRCAA